MIYTEINKPNIPSYDILEKPSIIISPVIDTVNDVINTILQSINRYGIELVSEIAKPSQPVYRSINKPE